MKRFMFSLVFLLPFASAAAAEDWTRFYAGIYGGYAAGAATFSNSVAYEPSGPELGVYFGHGLSAGPLVLALEGSVSGTAIAFGARRLIGLPGKVPPTSMSIGGLAGLRLQAGLTLGPVTPYAFAGGVAALITQTRPALPGPPSTSLSTALGVSAGGGLKINFPQGGHLRAEYGLTWLPASGSGPVSVTLNHARLGFGLPL